jgi:thiosulfate reductase cytochrome b subunit
MCDFRWISEIFFHLLSSHVVGWIITTGVIVSNRWHDVCRWIVYCTEKICGFSNVHTTSMLELIFYVTVHSALKCLSRPISERYDFNYDIQAFN